MADEEEAPPAPKWNASSAEDAPAGPFNEDGLPHGQGFMKYVPPPTGEDEEEKQPDTYEGSMVAGKREGQGKYTWSNGAVYEGSYSENKKHGKGKLTMPDKSVYEGDFVEDQMEGSGRYVYGNGDIYQGLFKAGKREGAGTYHYKEVGCQLVGEWEGGNITQGRWILKDGSMFHGTFDSALTPAEGAHYFTRTHLLQAGSYKAGIWTGVGQPKLGDASGLAKLVKA